MAVTADQALAAAKPQKCLLHVLTKAKAMEKEEGYFEVPGSDRILVATSVLGRVFEEETIETIHFWGTSLNSGFIQPSPRQKK